jgi:hypothetical protein
MENSFDNNYPSLFVATFQSDLEFHRRNQSEISWICRSRNDTKIELLKACLIETKEQNGTAQAKDTTRGDRINKSMLAVGELFKIYEQLDVLRIHA